ncbi:MAG: chalcone isomerase family protein [Desulfopila sp.]
MLLSLVALVSPLCQLKGQLVWAAEIAGVNIEEELAAEDGTSLKLNGAGIRSKFFFKIYIAELYLENPTDEAAAAIADTGYKRVVMHFLYDEVGQEKLVDGWNEGFSANLAEAAHDTLQSRIDAFNAMFTEAMTEGDRIVFDYVPGQGTRISIKGEKKGVIAGKDFNDALLSIWLGNEPVSSDLRRDMLQQ